MSDGEPGQVNAHVSWRMAVAGRAAGRMPRTGGSQCLPWLAGRQRPGRPILRLGAGLLLA